MRQTFDVGLLYERRAAELVDDVRRYLVEQRGCARRRFQISHAEARALWDAHCEVEAREEAKKKRVQEAADTQKGVSDAMPGDERHPFGKLMLEIERRAKRIQDANGDDMSLLMEQAELEGDFGKRHWRRQVRFDCSMLQTAVESPDGTVSWRDMKCRHDEGGDENDFEAL